MVTVELFDAFRTFCANRKMCPMPLKVFAHAIGPILKARFGVGNSHSLQRNGGWCRGYNGIRLGFGFFGTQGTAGTGMGQKNMEASAVE